MPRTDAISLKKPNLELRCQVLQSIRAYFLQQGFIEVQTPLLCREVAPENNIDPIAVNSKHFLVTSPELYMKRLLACGYEKIFQISPVFRSGERGRLHHPEFTLLEWYRTGVDYTAVQSDCERLIRSVCLETGRWPGWKYADQWLSADKAWHYETVKEVFERFVGWEPGPEVDQILFDTALLERIEPHLGFPSPWVIYDYPANQAALARLKTHEQTVAERFEVYWAGIELANGFSELTDPEEQRRRFENTLAKRKAQGQSNLPMPEAFLSCLPYVPQCAGVALGVDRLVMLLAGSKNIDEVVAFPPELYDMIE